MVVVLVETSEVVVRDLAAGNQLHLKKNRQIHMCFWDLFKVKKQQRTRRTGAERLKFVPLLSPTRKVPINSHGWSFTRSYK